MFNFLDSRRRNAEKNNLDIFSSTNTLRILSFMVENPGKEFLGSEIQKATALSRAGVFIALRELIKRKLVGSVKKGKFLMYSVAYEDPVVKQFKVLNIAQVLKPMIEKLKLVSSRLFFMAARAEERTIAPVILIFLFFQMNRNPFNE